LAVLSRAVRSHAVLAASAAPVALRLQVIERIQPSSGDDIDRSAAPAVAPGGAAFGDVLLAAEGDAAVPAVAGLHADGGLIDEHRNHFTATKLPMQSRYYFAEVESNRAARDHDRISKDSS